AILDDEEPTHFRVNDEGLSWRSLALTPAEVSAGRSQAAISYGSCSFDEPREDLQALGWLESQGER
ncbi:MAG: hypothetical protein H0T73_08540, partial [Ardenticatenales bacterium]|nr:hypothetical protein [Ardenticatenales bacterium]